MGKELIFTIVLFFLVFQSNSKMSDEKRNILLNKLTRKISGENADQMLKEKFYSQNLKEGSMTYDVEKIEAILKENNFPEYYNFFEDTDYTPVIKDQQRCGCCWSHAGTTALSYRYHKVGVDVDLSPQDALSCYLRDCDAGNYLIDTQMNLVKNGTVTEGCLPFSSGDGITIEECPTTCKDGSEYKKYYSQNGYITEDYYSQETFYDIVALIMDQLVTNGPVVTGIDVYADFMELHYDPEKCRNEVYTYDGVSEYEGGHAIVIVGYGYMNSKYYWLIQNSWGEWACDNGFVKVEFGQIGVESIAFSEPYFHKEIKDPKNIQIQLDSFDGECTMKVSTTSVLEDWQNTLDLGFRNEETNLPFNFQCSLVNIINEQKSVCYFEYYKFFADKGNYKFIDFNSLGDENTFTLDSSLKQKDFYYYGFDELYPIFSDYSFVSQEGSKIAFLYYNWGGGSQIPPIYANENSKTPLSDCKYMFLFGNEFIFCDIKQNEVDYFEDMNNMSNSPMLYDILCGYKEDSFLTVNKLDTTKYPVFKVKSFIAPQSNILTSESIFVGVADIEGSVKNFKKQKSYFYAMIDIEISGTNYSTLIECEINRPRYIIKNYLFNCYSTFDIEYDNVYLYPYILPFEIEDPYEVYIKDMIKAEKYDSNLIVPKIQVYIESLCPDCINFITKSFKNFYDNVQKPNLVDIEFIPFGNAQEKYNETTKRYDFTCQHGENECYGNLVETCTIQIVGKVKSYEAILCIESNIGKYEKNFDRTLEYCFSNDQTALQEINDCVESDMGNYYEHQMAQKTDINHKSVPWIIVDGVHNTDVENEIIRSLTDYICGDDMSKCFLN